MSPIHRRVEAAGIRGIRRKRDPSLIGPEAFFAEADELRRAFARLLEQGGSPVDPARVALLPSVSYGVAICARNAGLERGDEVVVARDQFPGNVYGWMRAASDAGARLRIVDPPAAPPRGAVWNQRLLEAMGPRTRIVALGHVHWADGTLFDLEALAARARDVGALVIVDGTQSIGALPFPMDAVRPDAVITAGYKWLLGPYSLALGWFGPAFDDGVPLEESWIAREGSRDFGGLVNYRDSYDPGAVRFDVGERSNFILLPMMLEALELLHGWGGPAAVQAHALGLTHPFVERMRDAGFEVEEEAAQASHLFGLRLPRTASVEAVSRSLAARRVVVSVRGGALRISPHLYNDEGDLRALEEALKEALEGALHEAGPSRGA